MFTEGDKVCWKYDDYSKLEEEREWPIFPVIVTIRPATRSKTGFEIAVKKNNGEITWFHEDYFLPLVKTTSGKTKGLRE